MRQEVDSVLRNALGPAPESFQQAPIPGRPSEAAPPPQGPIQGLQAGRRPSVRAAGDGGRCWGRRGSCLLGPHAVPCSDPLPHGVVMGGGSGERRLGPLTALTPPVCDPRATDLISLGLSFTLM